MADNIISPVTTEIGVRIDNDVADKEYKKDISIPIVYPEETITIFGNIITRQSIPFENENYKILPKSSNDPGPNFIKQTFPFNIPAHPIALYREKGGNIDVDVYKDFIIVHRDLTPVSNPLGHLQTDVLPAFFDDPIIYMSAIAVFLLMVIIFMIWR